VKCPHREPRNADAGGATHAQNTLSAETTEVQVYYPFHPLRGLTVQIQRRPKRGDGAAIVADRAGKRLKIPMWMLSPSSRGIRLSERAVLSKEALLSLSSVLAIQTQRDHDNLQRIAVDLCEGGHRVGDAAARMALTSKLEQLEFEARKAFEQYDAVDARNRLAASELERRWNEKLEAIAETKHRLSELDEMRYALSNEEEAQIRAMGANFSAVWESDLCPTELKKMIFRTAIEEIIVRTDAAKTTLQFTIHWKGGVHTQIEMQRPRGATDCATPMEALDIVRRMAPRHGDDQIASVLNRLGYSTGKGKRWNQTRVATARRNHSIAGNKRALPDSSTVSLTEAARISGVSHRTIERLVEAGLLQREQVAPRAPWQIRRADLDAGPVRSIIERLRRTGKLVLQGGCMENQMALFQENQGDDNARHHE
jgi:hypothetical protein